MLELICGAYKSGDALAGHAAYKQGFAVEQILAAQEGAPLGGDAVESSGLEIADYAETLHAHVSLSLYAVHDIAGIEEVKVHAASSAVFPAQSDVERFDGSDAQIYGGHFAGPVAPLVVAAVVAEGTKMVDISAMRSGISQSLAIE